MMLEDAIIKRSLSLVLILLIWLGSTFSSIDFLNAISPTIQINEPVEIGDDTPRGISRTKHNPMSSTINISIFGILTYLYIHVKNFFRFNIFSIHFNLLSFNIIKKTSICRMYKILNASVKR